MVSSARKRKSKPRAWQPFYGPGRILGVGNGDPSSHEPDTFVPTAKMRTRTIDGWRMKKGVNPYEPNIPEVADNFDDSSWKGVDVKSESGPLSARDRAVFRTDFNVTSEELSTPVVELWFGKIEGGVNYDFVSMAHQATFGDLDSEERVI